MGIKEFALQRAKSAAASQLKKAATNDQIAILSSAIDEGVLSKREIRRQLERNAPNEMRKGCRKQIKEGKTPTVDSLLTEYRTVPGFKELAERCELTEQWFVELAEQVIKEESR